MKYQKIIILGGKSDFRCGSEVVVEVSVLKWSGGYEKSYQ